MLHNHSSNFLYLCYMEESTSYRLVVNSEDRIFAVFNFQSLQNSQSFLIQRKYNLYTLIRKKDWGKEKKIGRARQMKAARERVTLSQWMSRGEVTLTTANWVQGWRQELYAWAALTEWPQTRAEMRLWGQQVKNTNTPAHPCVCVCVCVWERENEQ